MFTISVAILMFVIHLRYLKHAELRMELQLPYIFAITNASS